MYFTLKNVRRYNGEILFGINESLHNTVYFETRLCTPPQRSKMKLRRLETVVVNRDVASTNRSVFCHLCHLSPQDADWSSLTTPKTASVET